MMLWIAIFTLALSSVALSADKNHHIAKRFDWRDGDDGRILWSLDCDFFGNDLAEVKVPGEQCGGACLSNGQCTHFTWTSHDGGTCYLKRGGTSQDRATYLGSSSAVCGIRKGGGPNPDNGNGPTANGKTTRYWDCCKPSCSWPGKGPVTSPVKACRKDGWTGIGANEANGCGGGPSFTCSSNQPWAINDNLAYGFAAAHLTGQSEQNWCCACYELTFTSGPVNGKKLVVQVTNTGGDLGENHFDLQIPGGGVGLFNGCSPQFGAPGNGWGAQYGGISSKDQCNQLPSDLQPGCRWRFDWFQNADNPRMQMRKVRCPNELVEKTGCRRTDE